MAEQISQDVVKDAQSMSTSVPIDDIAKPTQTTSADSGHHFSQTALSQADSLVGQHNYLPDQLSDNGQTSAREDDSAGLDLGLEESKDDGILADDIKARLINGDSDNLSPSEDALGLISAVDVSGGSDTDTSREPSDAVKGSSSRHERSNSVKKPTSFKSVSVTKNFLAKTAVSTPPGRSDKSPVAPGQVGLSLQSAKPRLVAKSGSGFGNLPRSGLSKLNGAGSGPDASKVWNKNRPVPPPPQKQFTDEELKQQYGIHMATRLQSDETGKESKWADIDDDEDDWAPETVEWMDGTKTTVPTAAESKAAAPPEEPKSAITRNDTPQPPEATKSTPPPPSTTPKPSGASGANTTKTILKPGTHVQAPQPKQVGTILKGGGDKPMLVAKASAPVPAKSPWAQLPPVDKVPPVQINPAVQPPPPQARFGQRGPDGLEYPNAPSPAKEIAADDFSRSWREERGNRELFNSRSGRYEPVNEPRRGSFLEGGHRQPAVLQRPPQGQQGPAEPSAAFQTSRTGPSDGLPWGRRRNSSNVSGSSGRRMSFGRLPDGSAVLEEMQHRPVFAPMGDERGASPSRPGWLPHSPSLAQAQPASPYESVASSGPNDLPQGPPSEQAAQTGQPAQDPIVIQQQTMKERIERAKLAKQKELEEEARKEAEKRERLRAKLASLPVNEKPAELAQSPSSTPVEIALPKEKPVLTIQSPPKPPMPTGEGEVAQYGLMKVHPSHTIKKFSPSHDTHSSETKQGHKSSYANERQSAGRPVISPGQTSTEAHPLVRPPQDTSSSQAENDSQRSLGINSAQSHDRTAQPWNTSSETIQGWGATLTSGATAGVNVWGPPQLNQSKDKALGNGTFDNSYNRAHSRQTPQPPAHGPSLPPGPIAPPSKASSTHNQTPQSLPPYEQRGFSQAEMGQQPPANTQISQSGQLSTRPGPIAPPKSAASQAGQRRIGTSDWHSLVSNIHQQDADLAAKQQAEYEKRTAGRGDFAPILKETFKQTTSGADVGKRMVVKTESILHDVPSASTQHGDKHSTRPEGTQQLLRAEPNAAVNHEEPHTQRPIGAEKAQQGGAAGAGHRSRFFPRQPEAAQPVESASDSDAPPPPETYETHHPAFTGDANRPKVNLPVPKARVKLPPVSPPPPPQPQPVSMPPRPTPIPRLGSQPIVAQTAWQERINSLFATKPTAQTQNVRSPTTGQALAVSSASKAPLDVPAQRSSATVSLPATKATVFATDYDENTVSKVSPEETILEDREFGSLPRVFLPKQANMNAHLPPPPPMAQHRPNSKFHRTVDATSAEIIVFNMSEAANQQGFVINVHVPGKANKTVVMQRHRVRKVSGIANKNKRTFSHRGEKENRENSSGSGSGSRDSSNSKAQPRKGSSSTQKDSSSQSASPRTNSSGNGRSWSNNNNRNAPQGGGWSKPATPAVVH